MTEHIKAILIILYIYGLIMMCGSFIIWLGDREEEKIMCNKCHMYGSSPCPNCDYEPDYLEEERAERELWQMETGGDDCKDIEPPEKGEGE